MMDWAKILIPPEDLTDDDVVVVVRMYSFSPCTVMARVSPTSLGSYEG